MLIFLSFGYFIYGFAHMLIIDDCKYSKDPMRWYIMVSMVRNGNKNYRNSSINRGIGSRSKDPESKSKLSVHYENEFHK